MLCCCNIPTQEVCDSCAPSKNNLEQFPFWALRLFFPSPISLHRSPFCGPCTTLPTHLLEFESLPCRYALFVSICCFYFTFTSPLSPLPSPVSRLPSPPTLCLHPPHLFMNQVSTFDSNDHDARTICFVVTLLKVYPLPSSLLSSLFSLLCSLFSLLSSLISHFSSLFSHLSFLFSQISFFSSCSFPIFSSIPLSLAHPLIPYRCGFNQSAAPKSVP